MKYEKYWTRLYLLHPWLWVFVCFSEYYIVSKLWLLNLEMLWVEKALHKHDNILAMVVYKNIARQARNLIN